MNALLRLRHITCFLEIARRGSLTSAAAHLNISPPAASKNLRELEDILGKQLFDRSGRRLVLNSAGRVFQQYAGSAMIDLKRAQDLLSVASAEKTRLAIGILPSVATDRFPRAALQFRAAHPHAILRIATGPNWQLLDQLREGALDMVVGRMPNPEKMEGLSFQQLASEEVITAVRPGHPLLATDVSPQDIKEFPLILPPKGALIYPVVSAYLLRNGLQNIDPIFENVSLAFGRKAVMLSDSIWFISKSVIADEIAAGTIVRLPLRDTMMAGAVGISMRENTLMTDEITGLVQALMAPATPS